MLSNNYQQIPASVREAVQDYQEGRRTAKFKYGFNGSDADAAGVTFVTLPLYPVLQAARSSHIWSPRPAELRKSVFHGVKPSGTPELFSKKESKQIFKALRKGGVLGKDSELRNFQAIDHVLLGAQVGGLFSKRNVTPEQAAHVKAIVDHFQSYVSESTATASGVIQSRIDAKRRELEATGQFAETPEGSRLLEQALVKATKKDPVLRSARRTLTRFRPIKSLG